MRYPSLAQFRCLLITAVLETPNAIAQIATPVAGVPPANSQSPQITPAVSPPTAITPTAAKASVTPPSVAPNTINPPPEATNTNSTGLPAVDESKPVVDSTSVGISTGGVGNAVNQAGNRDLISPPYFNHSIKGGGLALPK